MANALSPAYADDLACQKFISSDSLSQLLLGCFFPVSYTHLDVYKRQLFIHLKNVFIQLLYGFVRIKLK